MNPTRAARLAGPRRGSGRRPFIPLAVALGAALAAAPALFAAVTITAPAPGLTVTANPCPNTGLCTALIDFTVEVTGAPMERLTLEFAPDIGIGFAAPICIPADPIEGIAGCPDPPRQFGEDVFIREGSWQVVARVVRSGGDETSDPLPFTVLPPNQLPAGPVRLSEVTPLTGSPALRVRRPSASHPDGLLTEATEVEIIGENLDNNEFLRVFLAPIPFGEPTLTAESGLPIIDWCLFEAEILSRQALPGGASSLTVRVPELPFSAPTDCRVPPGPEGSIFQKNWRWVIRDPWIRPEREHDAWAIPTPRQLPWHDAPPFRLVKPAYPLIDGFGFENKSTGSNYNEFLTVFGNNAYRCIDCLPLAGCACILPRIPDPLYHLLWFPIYLKAVNSTGGSCNGMSATSLLMAREELQTEDFDPDVLFPVGFDAAGDPARYRDSNFCTPVCSPKKPRNLWAHIRMNHGVQISREFLLEMLDTVGEALFDPNDLTAIKGVPQATLERVRDDPLGHVLCFFSVGNGHCVTPYRVEGDRIHVYDNNAPEDASRFIEISGGSYDYPARRDIDNKTPNSGKAIMAFPIKIWQKGRHLLGLSDLTAIGGVKFLLSIVVGDAKMLVTDDEGGRLGFERDGSFADAMGGALAVGPVGPQDGISHSIPILLAMNRPAPRVEIHADGGRYTFHAGEGGRLFQLESPDARAGDTDRLQLAYAEGDLESLDFTPQRGATRFVPRLGLDLAERGSAVASLLGLEVPGGGTAGFASDLEGTRLAYRNRTGEPTHHVVALDFATDTYGRMLYGPFEVPEGAEQRLVLSEWPEVGTATSELDFDGDGTADLSETVTGRPAAAATNQGLVADLFVEKAITPDPPDSDELTAYSVLVANAGPDDANGVTLSVTVPESLEVRTVETTDGACQASSAGVSCTLGRLPSGERALLTYQVAVVDEATAGGAYPQATRQQYPAPAPGAPHLVGAMVFGAESDPDWANNLLLEEIEVPD